MEDKHKYKLPESSSSQEFIHISKNNMKKKKKKKQIDHLDDEFLLLKGDIEVMGCKDGFSIGRPEINDSLCYLNSIDGDEMSRKRKRQNDRPNCDTDEMHISKKKKFIDDCDIVGGKMSNLKNVLRELPGVDDVKILREKKYEKMDIRDEKKTEKKKSKENGVRDKEIPEKNKHKESDVRDEKISKKKKKNNCSPKKKKVNELYCDGRILSFPENEGSYTKAKEAECLDSVKPRKNEKAHSYVHKNSKFDSSSKRSQRKKVKGKINKTKKSQYLNSDNGLHDRLSNIKMQSDGGLLIKQSEMQKFKEICNRKELDYEMSEQTNIITNNSKKRNEKGKLTYSNICRDLEPGDCSNDFEQDMAEFNSRKKSNSYKVRSCEKGKDESSSYEGAEEDEFPIFWQERDSAETGSYCKIVEALKLKDVNGISNRTNTRSTRKNALRNLPSFKEATEEEINTIKVHQAKGSNLKRGAINGLDEEAPFEGDRSSLEIPKEHEDYWKMLYSKIPENDMTEEEVNEEVERRLMSLVKKWDLVEKGILEKEAGPPEDFLGPYFPKMGHVEHLKSLNIKVKREISHLEERSWYFSIDSSFASACHDKRLKEEKFSWKTMGFSKREDDILKQNWQKFQKEYKFYDLRPLIGMRTVVVRKDGDDYTFHRLRYLSVKQTLDFLMYMLEDLPKRTILQVYMRLHRIGQCMRDGKFDRKNVTQVTGRQVAMLENLVRRFGANYTAIETVLGKRERKVYSDWCKQYLLYRKTKFFAGPWKKDEDLRLLRGMYLTLKPSSLRALVQTHLSWTKIWVHVGTRTQKDCLFAWRNRLGQMLTTKERVVYDKEKSQWPQLTDAEKLKLIDLVYESEADVPARVDWKGLCRDHFPRFFHSNLASCFYNFYISKVPNKKRHYFDDGIEYLYKYVRPLLKKKTERNDRRLRDVSKVIENLPLPEEAHHRLVDYYGDSHDVDEDEDVIDYPLAQDLNG